MILPCDSGINTAILLFRLVILLHIASFFLQTFCVFDACVWHWLRIYDFNDHGGVP